MFLKPWLLILVFNTGVVVGDFETKGQCNRAKGIEIKKHPESKFVCRYNQIYLEKSL